MSSLTSPSLPTNMADVTAAAAAAPAPAAAAAAAAAESVRTMLCAVL